MNKYAPIFMTIAVAISAIMFLATENIFLTLGVLATFVLFSFLFYIPMLTKFEKVSKRFHECYHFINNFIISLSIKKTISSALENTVLSMNEEFVTMFNSIENTDDMEKIRYLSGGYFPFHVYRLFVQIVELYEEHGGDVLESSKYLLNQCRYNEEYVSTTASLAKSKYFNFFVLWGIALSILVLLRFTLTDFYGYIKGQIVFTISLGVLSLFVAFSIFLLISKATSLELKGYNKNEKIT